MSLLARAVLNNALWCDAVCGHRGRFEPTLWLGPDVVPPYYPHAITLTADTAEQAETLGRVLGPGPRAVKDSFAAHDLRGLGLKPLFEAEWLGRPSLPPPPAGQWRRLSDPDPNIARLEIRRGAELLGQGILNFGAEVVGLSNVEAAALLGAEQAVRATLVAAAAQLWPGAPVVGYEPLAMGPPGAPSPRELMRSLGFEALGPLKVLTR